MQRRNGVIVGTDIFGNWFDREGRVAVQWGYQAKVVGVCNAAVQEGGSMYRNILVPLELEKGYIPHLRHAKELARRTHATVILLCVLPQEAPSDPQKRRRWIQPMVDGEDRMRAEQLLREIEQQLALEGVGVRSVVIGTTHSPGEVVIEYARQHGCDLIVAPATKSHEVLGGWLFDDLELKARQGPLVPILLVPYFEGD